MSLAPPLARLIRQDVQSMHAYAIQDSAGMVKLDAMENPHRLPPQLQAELGRRLVALALNRYPDGRVNDLRAALADYAHLPAGFDLMLGNGSDELISLLAMACDVPGAKILAPVPGFVMYAMSAQLQGLQFIGVPLTPEFELDLPAMLQAIAVEIGVAWPTRTTRRPICGTTLTARPSSTRCASRAAWWSWTRPTSLSPARATWTASRAMTTCC